MKWLERCLFPRSNLANFLVIACLSGALSFLLIGRQIYQANWGLIDDHEVFHFLGPGLQLPLTEIWSTLLAKTEVGTFAGRFRPGYYIFKLAETSFWGTNVHLWYLARTIGFAVFLSSIWWFTRRYAGIWLAGILTAYIALLPMWAGVWARLGPSEIYGATCIGIMIFATYFIFFSDTSRTRNVSAITLTLSTIVLVGMKETFLPIAGCTAAVLMSAAVRKKLSPSASAVLMLLIVAALACIVIVIGRQVVATGADFYAKTVELWPVLGFAGDGLLSAVRQTWWLYLTPILIFGASELILRKPLRSWIVASSITIGAYGLIVAMYAMQCALYRAKFPLNSRYDFPAMLLVPLSLCVLACYVFCMMRGFFSKRTINYAGFATASLACLYLIAGSARLDNGKALAAAVHTNIEATSSFYNELQRALRAAEKSPESPIILEAYGPGAYEPVFSLSTYLPALGARNRISIRLHPGPNSHGKLYDDLEQRLSELEKAGSGAFTPLRDSLASPAPGCVSIGITGPPDGTCSGFQVKTL
jgi:hypothetical protein